MLRREYIWQVPVRLTHWVNVLSIVVLSFTGYYIGNPYITVSNSEWWGVYFMGTVRYIHFLFAFIFVASLALRTYWAFAGNEWASWRNLFPFLNVEGRKSLGDAIKYYAFLRREPPEVIGHNALAGLTYMFIVALYFVQVFTGFALLGQYNPSGLWYKLTGWIFGLVSNQNIRELHHIIMYLIIVFALQHVYSAFLVDSEEGNGLMSSIFSGFKFLSKDLADRVRAKR
ncbi:MAG: Ni/Fe-hydrogenase, b-type cytochrome subunit [Chloroflexi bacterium]|nr:Ni/Fe-hydrogenase, b-type cytochrome subunit [Chloroflexota bacterium]